MSKRKQIDPIPEEFISYEEAAAFWDTHDTADYPEAFHPVEVESRFRKRYYEVEIEADVVKTLLAQAHKEGISVSQLASKLLREQLVAML